MAQINQDKDYRYYGSNDKEKYLIFKYSKGCATVKNIGKMEDIFYYRPAFALGNLLADNIFA